MKKNLLKALTLLFFPGIFVGPISPIFDAQLGAGYTGLSIEDNGSTGSFQVRNDTWGGLSINSSAHLNFSIPAILSVGFGPYLSYAPDMKYTGANAASGATFSNTQFIIGGEIQVKLLLVPVIRPYGKFGFGADTLKSVANRTGYTAEYKNSGSGFRIMGGIEIPIISALSIFGELGAAVSNYTATLVTDSSGKSKTIGYLVNIGVSLSI